MGRTVNKRVKRFIALALTAVLVMAFVPMTVSASAGIGYVESIQFTNATHHAVDIWEDIPQTPEHHMVSHMAGSIVSFANAPTTLTIRGEISLEGVHYEDWGYSSEVEFINSTLLNQLILPDGMTLMDYLKPSYAAWSNIEDLFDRLDSITHRPVHFNNLRNDGSTVLPGATVTLQEGIYVFRLSLFSSIVNILVVGNADTSVLSVYSGVATPPTTPTTPVTLPAQPPISVLLDGTPLTFDVPPQTMDGRTMVPMRAIFEALGAEVDWDAATQTATGTKDGTVVVLQIGSTSPTVNGSVVTIDAPGVVIDGRTLVPLRFVAESFGVDVDWDGETRTITITS